LPTRCDADIKSSHDLLDEINTFQLMLQSLRPNYPESLMTVTTAALWHSLPV